MGAGECLAADRPCLEGLVDAHGTRRPDSSDRTRRYEPPLRDSAGISPDFAGNRASDSHPRVGPETSSRTRQP